MPRNPDLPCAGCGKLMWRHSRTSRPAGKARCNDCRRAQREAAPATPARERKPKPTCEVCSSEYRRTYPKQRTCGRACGQVLSLGYKPEPKVPASRVWIVECSECSTLFAGRQARARACSQECRRKRMSRMTSASIMQRYNTDPQFRDQVLTHTHARRAEKLGRGSKRITIAYLIKRDRAMCGICRQRVRAPRGPDGPSLDHVVPLSRGGQHELSNVQLTHLRCNHSKGNRGSGEQLALIG